MRIITRQEGLLNFHEIEQDQFTFGELRTFLHLTNEHIFIQNGENRTEDDLIKDRSIIEISEILLGGKGGFGSLLKGQPPVKKRTTNVDSCRDLTGKRIRHVNQEKMIREWEQKKSDEDRIMRMYNNPDEEKNVAGVLNDEKKIDVQEMNRKFITEALETVKSVSKSIKFLNKKQKRKEEFEAGKNFQNGSRHKKINLDLDDVEYEEEDIERELLDAYN